MHPLERNTSRGCQIGCSFFLALLLAALGGGAMYKAWQHPETSGNWVIWAVGGGFSLVALILLYAGIHQVFALKSPLTQVSMEHKQLRRGQRTAFHFRQPGPMELESLRANLVGTRTERRGKNTKYIHLGTFNFFDSGPVTIDESVPMQRNAHLDVPEDIAPTGDRVSWQIEVWGKVRGRADFQHVFPVDVI